MKQGIKIFIIGNPNIGVVGNFGIGSTFEMSEHLSRIIEAEENFKPEIVCIKKEEIENKIEQPQKLNIMIDFPTSIFSWSFGRSHFYGDVQGIKLKDKIKDFERKNQKIFVQKSKSKVKFKKTNFKFGTQR